MKILFCKSNSISGFLIRLLTFSQWNHVALEFNGRVIDSTFSRGVSEVGLHEFRKRYSLVRSIDVAGVNEFAAWDLMRSQLGKSYDWTAIIALPFREDWQRDRKWFCSELVAAGLRAGGKRLNLQSWRVTPRDLWVSL